MPWAVVSRSWEAERSCVMIKGTRKVDSVREQPMGELSVIAESLAMICSDDDQGWT